MKPRTISFLPSSRRKPGSSALARVGSHWIPAFAGMTTVGACARGPQAKYA